MGRETRRVEKNSTCCEWIIDSDESSEESYREKLGWVRMLGKHGKGHSGEALGGNIEHVAGHWRKGILVIKQNLKIWKIPSLALYRVEKVCLRKNIQCVDKISIYWLSAS